MTQAGQPAPKANTAVPNKGDHDRVVMLSLQADGTADQHNPEIIGDKDFAIAAAKVQFAQQAVSAVDVEARGVSAGPGVTLVGQPDGTTVAEPLHNVDEDPVVAELREKHEKAQAAAEKAAVAAITALIKD